MIKSRQIISDLSSSPIRTSKLTADYLLGAFVVGPIMILLALFLGKLFIVFNVGAWLTLNHMIKVLGLIVLSVLSNTAFVYFFISFPSN